MLTQIFRNRSCSLALRLIVFYSMAVVRRLHGRNLRMNAHGNGLGQSPNHQGPELQSERHDAG